LCRSCRETDSAAKKPLLSCRTVCSCCCRTWAGWGCDVTDAQRCQHALCGALQVLLELVQLPACASTTRSQLSLQLPSLALLLLLGGCLCWQKYVLVSCSMLRARVAISSQDKPLGRQRERFPPFSQRQGQQHALTGATGGIRQCHASEQHLPLAVGLQEGCKVMQGVKQTQVVL
jgi:ABC-type nickel/cobalt efflux system permease component RcnA